MSHRQQHLRLQGCRRGGGGGRALQLRGQLLLTSRWDGTRRKYCGGTGPSGLAGTSEGVAPSTQETEDREDLHGGGGEILQGGGGEVLHVRRAQREAETFTSRWWSTRTSSTPGDTLAGWGSPPSHMRRQDVLQVLS